MLRFSRSPTFSETRNHTETINIFMVFTDSYWAKRNVVVKRKCRREEWRTSYRSTINFFFTSVSIYNLELEKKISTLFFFSFAVAFFVSFS